MNKKYRMPTENIVARRAASDMTTAEMKAFRDNIGTSGWELILEQEASADTSVVFTDFETAGFKNTILMYDDITLTDSTSFIMRVSNDNGSSFISTATYTKSGLETQTASPSTAFAQASTSATSFDLTTTSTPATTTLTGQVWLRNMLDASANTVIQLSGAENLTGTGLNTFEMKGKHHTKEVHNAIQVSVTAGTMSGTFRLYGVAND